MRFFKTLLAALLVIMLVIGGCGGGGGGSSGSSSDAPTPETEGETGDDTEDDTEEGTEDDSTENPDRPAITIATPQNITSANQTTYYVLGTCSEDGMPVEVSVGSVSSSVDCLGSSWFSGNLDVSVVEDTSNLLITADHTDNATISAIQAQAIVFKNTTTPIVTIATAPAITADNVTDYEVTGLCSENGEIITLAVDSLTFTPNCSAGSWSTGFVDVSIIPDHPAVDVTADHKNQSGDSANPASTTVVKDLTLPTVSISSAPDINSSNQASYTTSGTCSESDQTVDISIETLQLAPLCLSNTWMLSSIDLSSLEDSPEVLVTADHKDVSGDAAAQAVKTIAKATATPSISDLSLVSTLSNLAEIRWSLEDPGGFSIDDYRINYRVSGTGVWLLFVDGVSTSTHALVTALNPSTAYDFRVAVVYEGSSQSAWSSTIHAETKPENPIFGMNKAINVGGAVESSESSESIGSSVVAFEDNTQVFLNESKLVVLNQGETYLFDSSQFDVIDADKPIFTAGRIGPNDAGRFGANMVWVPATWAGRHFSFNATRYNPQRVEVFPIEDGTITIKTGSSVLASTEITAGVGTFLEWSTYGSYQISATGMVLLFHYSSGSGSYVDPKPLLPAAKKIIGFPSQSMRLTASFDGTNYSAIHSNSVTAIANLNKQDSVQINPEGTTTSLYQSDSLLIMADREVSGASYADSNGYAASVFLPTALMKKTHALNADADYVALASLKPGLVKVLDSNNTIITAGSLTRSGDQLNSPYRVRFGNLAAGTRLFSTVPVAAWYQPSGYTGSMRNDETILFGTDLDDPTSVFTPPENPVTCLTLKQESPELADGVYEIDPDGDEGEDPYSAYCDMTTQGGGWTLVMRYDRDLATALEYSLPQNAGRSAINSDDMLTLEATTNLAASLDIRPFIMSGATHFMHVTTASNDTQYTHTYFHDIDLLTRMYPDAIFDPSRDSNAGEGVSGTVVDWSESNANRWYESDFSLMTNSQTTGSPQNSHRSISGGEGLAMFTNGNREGAVYCSGVATSGSVEGHANPKVQWGFKGKDGTTQVYGGETHVGTFCNSSLSACTPVSRLNFMFIR